MIGSRPAGGLVARSIAIAVFLGTLAGSAEYVLRQATLHALARVSPPDGLPAGAAKGFEAFRTELAYRVAGDKLLMPWDVGAKRLSIIRSEKLDNAFPTYFFLRTDWTSRVWAVPKETGPIWYLDDWSIIGDFLAYSRTRIRNKEDAARLNELCTALMPRMKNQSNENETDNMRRWRIGVWRPIEKQDVFGPSFFEVNLDASGFIECGFLVSQDPRELPRILDQ